MSGKTNVPKRHHINPEVLLRQFADEDDFVRVVPKNGGRPRLQTLNNTSVVGHANTLETDLGRDFSLEELLAKVEGYFPEVFRLLDVRARTSEETSLILSLVATQVARDPWNRNGVFGEVAVTYDALAYALREENAGISQEESDGEIEHYGRSYIVASHVSPAPENIAVAGTPWLIGKLYDELAPYRLTVLHSKNAAFFTADSPVSVHPARPEDRDVFAFLPDTEFLLPVTPRHAVLITAAYELPEWLNADRDVELIVNARTAKATFREIYCPPSSDLSEVKLHMDAWWSSMPLLRAFCT